MSVALLIIGDELTHGEVIDLNGSWLAKQLGLRGISVDTIQIVGDAHIVPALTKMLEKHSLIITTGGLGPTHDDITVQSIGEVLGLPLVFFPEAKRHKATSEKELTLPQGCEPIINPTGTAPGIMIEHAGKKIISFPGVPTEMRVMCEPVIYRLFMNREGRDYSRDICFCHATETMIADKLRELEKENPEIALGVYPGRSLVRVAIRGHANSREEFFQQTDPIAAALIDIYPTRYFTSSDASIEMAVHAHLIRTKKTLFLAESCTGGHLAARLTRLPGASNYLVGGIVAYSNKIKEGALNVSHRTLARHGAVSLEVVAEMAEGAFKQSGADYVISVSGIAGPDGGTEEKPVGTIWAAVVAKGERISPRLIQCPPHYPRDVIIERTVNQLLGGLYRKMRYGVSHDHE